MQNRNWISLIRCRYVIYKVATILFIKIKIIYTCQDVSLLPRYAWLIALLVFWRIFCLTLLYYWKVTTCQQVHNVSQRTVCHFFNIYAKKYLLAKTENDKWISYEFHDYYAPIKHILYINKFIIIEISYFSIYSAQKIFSVPTNWYHQRIGFTLLV